MNPLSKHATLWIHHLLFFSSILFVTSYLFAVKIKVKNVYWWLKCAHQHKDSVCIHDCDVMWGGFEIETENQSKLKQCNRHWSRRVASGLLYIVWIHIYIYTWHWSHCIITEGRKRCTHKWSCRLNALPHIVQTYLRSSLCVSLCFVSAEALLNTLPHTCKQKNT